MGKRVSQNSVVKKPVVVKGSEIASVVPTGLSHPTLDAGSAPFAGARST